MHTTVHPQGNSRTVDFMYNAWKLLSKVNVLKLRVTADKLRLKSIVEQVKDMEKNRGSDPWTFDEIQEVHKLYGTPDPSSEMIKTIHKCIRQIEKLTIKIVRELMGYAMDPLELSLKIKDPQLCLGTIQTFMSLLLLCRNEVTGVANDYSFFVKTTLYPNLELVASRAHAVIVAEREDIHNGAGPAEPEFDPKKRAET